MADDDTDTRPDIQQAVEAREDALKRGEGGRPTPDVPGSVGGTDGEVKNQGDDAQ